MKNIGCIGLIIALFGVGHGACSNLCGPSGAKDADRAGVQVRTAGAGWAALLDSIVQVLSDEALTCIENGVQSDATIATPVHAASEDPTPEAGDAAQRMRALKIAAREELGRRHARR